jgi:hypothetical protein
MRGAVLAPCELHLFQIQQLDKSVHGASYSPIFNNDTFP